MHEHYSNNCILNVLTKEISFFYSLVYLYHDKENVVYILNEHSDVSFIENLFF